jgi:hypothetical protein
LKVSIREELLAIKGDNEFLIVEEAEVWARAHPDSYLHRSLEWDNEKAGHEYRLHQLRRLIAIHIVSEEGTREMISLSIDRSREGGGYREVDSVLASKTLHEIMLADALRELRRVQVKYEHLKELKPVWGAVDKVRKKRSGKGGDARATA